MVFKIVVMSVIRGIIERFSDEGFGIIRVSRREIFVLYIVLGDVVEVVCWRRKKKKLIVMDFKVIEEFLIRIELKCLYFGVCGGCFF